VNPPRQPAWPHQPAPLQRALSLLRALLVKRLAYGNESPRPLQLVAFEPTYIRDIIEERNAVWHLTHSLPCASHVSSRALIGASPTKALPRSPGALIRAGACEVDAAPDVRRFAGILHQTHDSCIG
jgi:hypothetical protein